ncbi:MAG: HD domain-containing protein [Planctomycetaceae bacterium]|nr:HD domain-containing protein [Planctomycetaceae bacterium]
MTARSCGVIFENTDKLSGIEFVANLARELTLSTVSWNNGARLPSYSSPSIGDEAGAFLDELDLALQQIDSEPELVEVCLTRFIDRVPAEGMSIQRFSQADQSSPEAAMSLPNSRGWHSRGRCPLPPPLADNLAEVLRVAQVPKPVVVNRSVSQSRSWPYPEVRQAIVRALRKGEQVWGYLTVFNHLEDAEFDRESAWWVEAISQAVEQHLQRMEAERSATELGITTAEVLLRSLQQKDNVTYEHSLRVGELSLLLAKNLGCSFADQQMLYLGAILHDIGKLSIDGSILRKAGDLSDSDLERLREHPQLGHDLLKCFDSLAHILPIALFHHEQPDGGGYPLGLELDQIPWPARLVSVADSYDALTRDRPYRQGYSHERAMQILREGAGQQWDAEMVRALESASEAVESLETRAPLLRVALGGSGLP